MYSDAKSQLKTSLTSPPIVIASVSATLYLVGAIFSRSYLSAYGADVTWFSLSLSQMLMFGLPGIVFSAITTLAWLLVLSNISSPRRTFWSIYSVWAIFAIAMSVTSWFGAYWSGARAIVTTIGWPVLLCSLYLSAPIYFRNLRVHGKSAPLFGASSRVADNEGGALQSPYAIALCYVLMLLGFVDMFGRAKAVVDFYNNDRRTIVSAGEPQMLFTDGQRSLVLGIDRDGFGPFYIERPGIAPLRLSFGGMRVSANAVSRADAAALSAGLANLGSPLEESNEATTRKQLLLIQYQICQFYRSHGTVPKSLRDLDGAASGPLDVWGHEVLISNPTGNISDLIVLSLGPDGTIDTPDDFRAKSLIGSKRSD